MRASVIWRMRHRSSGGCHLGDIGLRLGSGWVVLAFTAAVTGLLTVAADTATFASLLWDDGILPTSCRQSVVNLSTGCRQSVDRLPTFCRQSVVNLSTGCRQDVALE